MTLFAILALLAVTLLKTVAVAAITGWFSLGVFHLFPALGNYLVKLFGFDK